VTRPNQGLSSLAPGEGKRRGPGNEVDLGSFYYALSKHPLQGDYKRMTLGVCDKFPDLRDSNPSTYWVCFLNIYHL